MTREHRVLSGDIRALHYAMAALGREVTGIPLAPSAADTRSGRAALRRLCDLLEDLVHQERGEREFARSRGAARRLRRAEREISRLVHGARQ